MTDITSSNADRTAEIDRCLSLITPSQPDESKFVGMLLLPRLLQQNEPESVQRVFDGMNFKFIERLLRTNTSDSQIPGHVLREIAVNVLACFAHYDNMAATQPMADRIPGLSTILTANDSSDTTQEALHTMLCIAVSKEGLVRMLDPDVLKNILELVAETSNQKERQLGTQLIHSTFVRTCHLLHEKSVASLASALKYALPTLFTALSGLLDKHQDELKFEALDLLSSILPNLPSEVVRKFKGENTSQLSSWLDGLRSGLRQLLTTKLGDKYRDQAMVTTACLLRYFGTDWLFGTLQKTKQSRRRSEKKPSNRTTDVTEADIKFPQLLIHLVAVETRVILDDIHDRRVNEHNLQAVEVDEEKEKRQEIMLPIYYEILESAIQYLSSHYDEERDTGMDAEVLLKIRTALTDTMNVVMELLKFVQDTSSDDQLENDMVAQASMRIVAVYLAEEGYEME
ncbi:hypothetical protein K492DRAFT_239452 [Lichtheimia hyalospora FSU 10163]|nr:hypothetical protein K492DRAFT_239452 [Lichtheimia hyalospora FSU 10163]